MARGGPDRHVAARTRLGVWMGTWRSRTWLGVRMGTWRSRTRLGVRIHGLKALSISTSETRGVTGSISARWSGSEAVGPVRRSQTAGVWLLRSLGRSYG